MTHMGLFRFVDLSTGLILITSLAATDLISINQSTSLPSHAAGDWAWAKEHVTIPVRAFFNQTA
jgi:hypothetical protein